MSDSYLYIIVALLPLAAVMLTVQVNPYHALVLRGILGGIAALVYVVLGAADVALTEALVGTMLAITLYAVAVRSSLVMRLGVLNDEPSGNHDQFSITQLTQDLQTVADKYHLRLEVIPYDNVQSLKQAIVEKDVHMICTARSQTQRQHSTEDAPVYETQVRVRRLYEILQTELTTPITGLTYVTVQDSGEMH